MIVLIYVIEGKDRYLAKNKIDEILEKHQLKDIQSFGKKDSLEDIQNALYSFSLFDDFRAVILEDFLQTESQVNFIQDYLNDENDAIVLIMIFEKLDARKKITTILKNQNNYFKIDEINSYHKANYIRLQLKQFEIKIQEDALQHLIKYLPTNAGIIAQELKKLQLLNCEITYEIVDEFSSKYYEDSTFEFVDVFLNGTIEERYTYFERIKKDEPEMLIIGALAGKLRLIYQVCHFYQTMRKEDIQSLLQVKQYPLTLAYRYADSEKELYYLRLLNELAQIQYDIRHGLVNGTVALTQFILKKGHYEIN